MNILIDCLLRRPQTILIHCLVEREVTVYEEGYGYDCTEAVSDMEEELIALINYVSIDIYKLVKSYMDRLSHIVNQINANLQN